MTDSKYIAFFLASLLLVACDSTPEPVDAGTDAGSVDAGTDAGPEGCTDPPAPGPAIPDPGPASPPPALDCGTPEIVSGTALMRWPYLESTTSTSVRVAWTTTSGGAGTVRWAPDPGGPWTEVPATAEAFDVARTGQAADYVAYDAVVSGLADNTAYCYEIVEDGTVLARNLRFDTAWGGTERPVRILALGDSGSGSDNQLAVRDALMDHEYDIFVHLGDMAYEVGTFEQFEANFFTVYQDLMHRVPVFPAIGNHEYLTDNGQPYRDVYHLFEQALNADDSELYYSFDYGNVHFTVLDSNEATLLPIAFGMTGDDDMFDWMVDDITSSDADWKVVAMHHPFFSSSGRFIRTQEHLIEFRRLLEEAGVDLILVGHDHHYERTNPLYGRCNAAEPVGVTEIVVGGSGRGLRDISEDNWFSAVAYNADYSYLRMEIHGCGLHGVAYNTANEPIDDFELNGCDP